ncbi:hypothetical protein GEMRC1_009271 [Eukaryota sp. GEM-RC1]
MGSSSTPNRLMKLPRQSVSQTESYSCTISFPQSLIQLISYHSLKQLVDHIPGPRSRSTYRKLTITLLAFVESLGCVSQHFFESSLTAIHTYLKHNGVCCNTANVSWLTSLTNFFGVTRPTVHFSLRGRDTPLINCEYLRFDVVSFNHNLHLTEYFGFLSKSSPLYFPRLRCLDLVIMPQTSISSFAEHLMTNDTVLKLVINFPRLTEDQCSSLAKVFSSNTTLKQVSVFSRGICGPQVLGPIPASLLRNKLIRKIKIFGIELDETTFGCSEAKPLSRYLDVIQSKLTEFGLTHVTFKSELLAVIVNHNTHLKRLKLKYCTFDFSTFFKFLESNTSLLELYIRVVENPFTDQEIQSFVEMLEMNTSLLVLNLDGLLYTSSSFPIVLNALENNSSLMKVRFSSLDLGCVIQIVDILASNRESRLTSLIDFSPNYVDLDRGVFQFSRILRPGFEDPFKAVAASEVSSLQIVLDLYKIKHLTIGNCKFTDESIRVLSSFFKVNTSLTFVDFSRCELTSDNLINLIVGLLINSCLKTVILKSNKIDDEAAIIFAELLTDNSTVTEIDLSHNSITGRGALALFGAIQSNHRVKILNLCRNKGIKQISKLMVGTSSLDRIKI